MASYAQYYFTYFQEKSRKRCQAEEIKGNKPGYRRKSEKLLSFLRTQCRFGPFFQQRIILSFYDGIHHFQVDHPTPCLLPKFCITIDLIMVLGAIMMGRKPSEKLQCLYENLISNYFHKSAVLEKTCIVN